MDALWRQRQAAKIRLAATHADTLRDAIRSSVDVKKIVDDFINSHFDKPVTNNEARAWTAVNVYIDDTKLSNALTNLYAEGIVFGKDAALNALALLEANKAPTAQVSALTTPWENWAVGNRAAATLIRPSGALSKLLQSRGTTLVGLDNTTKDRIGVILARALKTGLPANAIASQIADVLSPLRQQIANSMNADITLMLSDSERALMIAQTELTRAVNVASRDMYTQSGVELVEWLVSDPCPECEENNSVSPIGINETFPSGDSEPPAHPNCACDLSPYVVDTMGLGSDAIDQILADSQLALHPTINKDGVPDALDVERAIARLEILPNPNHPDIPEKKIEKYVESPWSVVDVPTINPNSWSEAQLELIALQDLSATDPYLKRKKVKSHIENMGQSELPKRSYALIAEIGSQLVIIDGHHRLMALWLLGLDTAPVWLIKE